MIRIDPIEDSLPKEWRRAVRDHPWLSVSAAAAAGVYLGRHHGRQLLAALVSVGMAVGVETFRRAIGIEPAPARQARKA